MISAAGAVTLSVIPLVTAIQKLARTEMAISRR